MFTTYYILCIAFKGNLELPLYDQQQAPAQCTWSQRECPSYSANSKVKNKRNVMSNSQHITRKNIILSYKSFSPCAFVVGRGWGVQACGIPHSPLNWIPPVVWLGRVGASPPLLPLHSPPHFPHPRGLLRAEARSSGWSWWPPHPWESGKHVQQGSKNGFKMENPMLGPHVPQGPPTYVNIIPLFCTNIRTTTFQRSFFCLAGQRSCWLIQIG